MLGMPVLETARLEIRPFVMEDLPEVHRLLDIEFREADLRTDKLEGLDERAAWLRWTILNYDQLARLHQPPYGDRAIVLNLTGKLIGACGFVPCLNAFQQIPGFRSRPGSNGPSSYTTEFGLFYAISAAHRRQGYAFEAASALIEYAFVRLRLARIVATTTYDNTASVGLMRKLGMRVERNPLAEPPWLQVVGALEADRRP